MQTSKLLLAAAALSVVSGCTTSIPAPVQDRSARPAQPPQPQILSSGPVATTPINPALPGNTAGSQFHVVQRGETLYGIARNNNVDINALAAWNNLIVAQPLREGQVLRLQPSSDAALGVPSSATFGVPSSVAPSATLTPIPTTGAIQGQPLPPGPTAVITSVTPIGSAPSAVTPIDAPLKREP